MPNPKRRHSKKRTSTRRAHDSLTARSLSECPNCHERKLPHRACPKCGYYKGREVLEVEESRYHCMHRVMALDAMRADRAPKPEIEGAIQASRRFGIHVALVGPEETL